MSTRPRPPRAALAALVAGVLGCTESTPVVDTSTREPPRDYVILVHSELGMHCTGFDFSYCCVLPPYNSILTQVIRTDPTSGPRMLEADPDDSAVMIDGERRIQLAYRHEDADGRPNTHSEHKKMVYWGADYDHRTLASEQFRHLYIYDDLSGGNRRGTTANADKRRVGEAWHLKIDRGPTNQHVGRGHLRNSGPTGTVFFTDSPSLENVPLRLSPPNTWEALGLPLTPFSDYAPSTFFLEETDVRPFQRAIVSLVDVDTGQPVLDRGGDPAQAFGVNPIDVPACDRCHATANANGTAYRKWEEEYRFWRDDLRTGEWFARLKAASISILEIHDAKHGTSFTAHYPAGATLNTRLGHDSVRCQDCHADNVIGSLRSRRIRDVPQAERGPDFERLNPDPERLIPPLTEAMHALHQRARPMPDSFGRTGACQGCHPAHRDDGRMDGYPIASDGSNPYAQGDNRDAVGGCFVGRGIHSKVRADDSGERHLNAIGKWLRDNVSGPGGSPDGKAKGLTCTNCHTRLSRELYRHDRLTDAVLGQGETLRNRSLPEIAEALGLDADTLTSEYLDPRVPAASMDFESGVFRLWSRDGRPSAPLAILSADATGTPRLTPPDVDGDRSVIVASADPGSGAQGVVVSYDAGTNGRDYWLAPGEPHCADCHTPPFVESEGGAAFPIDQKGKYSLMRYSVGHAGIHCQGCHGSSHGLAPVGSDVDSGTRAVAISLNPDGSPGPLRCGACHVTNDAGVPTSLASKTYRGKPLARDYELAIEYAHTLR